MFAFNNGDKFAIVAVEDADTDFPTSPFEKHLGDEVWAFDKMPAEIDDTWKKWIGSIESEALSKCNMVLLCRITSASPDIVDGENRALGNIVTQVFYQLQLSGVVEYSHALCLTGAYYRSSFDVRQFSELPKFLLFEGLTPIPVNALRLDKAKTHRDILAKMYGSSDYTRFKKGWRVLMDGLKQDTPAERLHHFVRAIEALILPRVGSTKKNFKHRCQILAKTDQNNSKILDEVFELRSMAEHLNDWEPVLGAYPQQDRNNIAMLRTRQIEIFASSIYTAVFDNSSLLKIFQTDSKIAGFWSLSDTQKKVKWGNGIDLTTIK